MIPLSHRIAPLFAVAIVATPMAAKAQGEDVKTQLSTLSIGATVDQLFIMSSGKVTELTGVITGVSPGIEYKGSQAVRIFDSEAAAKDPTKAPFAVGIIPKGSSHTVLILHAAQIAEAKGKADARVMVPTFDLSAKGGKKDDMLILNESEEELVIQFGENAIGLAPGANAYLSPPRGKEPIPVMVRQGKLDADPPGPAYFSANWPRKPKEQSLVVISKGRSPAYPVVVGRFTYRPH